MAVGHCNHCPAEIEFDESLTGQEITCPQCGSQTRLPSYHLHRPACVIPPSPGTIPNAGWLMLSIGMIVSSVIGFIAGRGLHGSKSSPVSETQIQTSMPAVVISAPDPAAQEAERTRAQRLAQFEVARLEKEKLRNEIASMEFELQQFGMTQRQKNALATLRIYGVDVDPSSSAENMIEIISKYPEIHNLPRDMPAISMEISTRWFRLQQKKDRLMELNASP